MHRKNRFQRVIKHLVLALFIVFLILTVGLYLTHRYLIHEVEEKAGITLPGGIDSLWMIELNGLEQWMLVRGRDRANPVLLYLHGGPGAPLFCNARDIGYATNLERAFTMVYWEQRGTGKSFSLNISESSMTIEQLLADTHDLTLYLTEHFKVDKIFLAGKSFGSLIGMLTVNRFPEFYHAYVGIGQIVSPLKNDSIAYEYTLDLAKRFGNQQALAALSEVGYPPYSFEEALIQSKWLTRFDRRLLSEKFGKERPNYYYQLLATPEYSLKDIIAMGLDPYFSMRCLWDDTIYQINLFDAITTIDIPLFFIAGRYDYFSSGRLAEQFYQHLKAPRGKSFFWFERSGHDPEIDEPQKFGRVLSNRVKQVIRRERVQGIP